jgi:hypothetical protein
VSAIIRDGRVSIDLRCEMIRLAEAGMLTRCLPALLHRVADGDEDPRVKRYAVNALAQMADTKTRDRVAKVAQRLKEIPSDLCASLVRTVYPFVVGPSEIGELLRKTEYVDIDDISVAYAIESYFAQVVTPPRGMEMLKMLVQLLTEGHRSGDPVETHFLWLIRPIEPVLKAALRLESLTDDEATLVGKALLLLGDTERRYHPLIARDRELNELTRRHASVRRAFFWQFVEQLHQKEAYRPRHLRHVFGPEEALNPLPNDFSWLVVDIRGREILDDRLVALRAAFELWVEGDRRRSDRVKLQEAAADQPELRLELQSLLREVKWLRARKVWHRQIHQIASRWWWHRKVRDILQLWSWIVGQWRLITHLPLLRSGHALGWLMILSREADKQNNNRWAPEKWDDLVAKRGRLIARAARAGCKQAWKRFWPPLPHEELEPNKTDPRIIIGLTGLQAAFVDNELDFPTLTAKDVRRAARYGVNELNGFTSWFPTLARVRKDEVSDVLGQCVEGEWAFSRDRREVSEVLSKLVWQGKDLTTLVDTKVWAMLRIRDPENVKILEYALTVLLRGEFDRSQLAALAASRAVYTVCDPSRCVLWLAVLLLIDASLGIDILERLLSANTWSDNIVVRLCALIGGDRFATTLSIEDPSYEKPYNLRRFIPLVYQHVRLADDIDRSGGRGYTPTARDHSQEFRGRLLQLLAQHDDVSVPRLLFELMTEPELQHLRDWILRLIDEWRKRNADLAPWTAADIRLFARENEIDPKTDGDLFAIACKRINEIKLDVEKAENSLRSELHSSYVEPELRKWLQRKLRERARGRYTVPQEAEIDLQQRPDLRLENPRTPATSIEVKWAQNWSVSELRVGLTTQLADQYLRAHNARYGVYVLGMIGDKKYWENPSDKARLSFQQLLDFLRNEATKLVNKRADIEDIAVIGMDFRMPQ